MFLPRGRLLLILLLTLAASPARSEPPAEKKPPARLDRYGDPLPEGVLARMGSGRMRHGDFCRLTFAPNGKSLVSGSAGGGIRVWDVATGKLKQRFSVPSECWSVAFAYSADGATVTCINSGKACDSWLIDMAAGKELRRINLKADSQASEVAVSGGGKLTAVARGDGSLRLYETASGLERLRIPIPGGWVRDLVFAPDAKTIALTPGGDTVYLHDTSNGKRVAELRREGPAIMRTAYSADGRFLASIYWDDATRDVGEASIWDVASGKERHRLQSQGRYLMCAAFSPDGKFVATGGQRPVLWNMATGKEVRRFTAAPSSPWIDVTFSPDGKTLAAVNNVGAITVWDVTTGRLLPQSADPIGFVFGLRFAQDGKQLIGSSRPHVVWDSSTGRELRKFPNVGEYYWNIHLSPDESLLCSPDRCTIRLWDVTTGKEVRSLKGHEGGIWTVLFAPEGRRLISSSVDGTIRVWDVASGRQLHKLTGHGVQSLRLAISPDGRWLASASQARGPRGVYEIHLWDLTTGKEKHRIPTGSTWAYQAQQLAFSPDSRFLAAVGGDWQPPDDRGQVWVWNVATGQQWRSFAGNKVPLWSVAFSPDGRMVGLGDAQGALLLWELASEKVRHRFVGHDKQVGAVAFSPDGRRLAAVSYDAPVYVWDVTGSLEPPRQQISKASLERAWADLASDDAAKAFEAMRRLLSSPKDALPLFKDRLQPISAPDRRRIAKLVADLDDKQFTVREKAAEELAKLAELAEPALRKALENDPSPETRRRIGKLLDALAGPITFGDALRALRAIEVLEYIGTAEAQALLKELAKGATEARLTQEAKAALDRLAKRPAAKP